MAKIAWNKAAHYVDEVYDTYVNLEPSENEDCFFICPECGDPISDEDFPELELHCGDGVELFYCPVCETPI